MSIIKKPLLIAFLGLFCSNSFALENYTLDPNHTYVQWHVNHFGFSNPSGKWFANGHLQMDKDNVANSKMKVVIKVADAITGIKKLDDHLKSKEFFDTAKFPTATFESEKIESTDNKNAKINGTLTVKGISKPVTIDAVINKMGVNPVSNIETVGFSGHTQLKRSDFGLNAYLPGLGDEVTLEIEGEANKGEPAKSKDK